MVIPILKIEDLEKIIKNLDSAVVISINNQNLSTSKLLNFFHENNCLYKRTGFKTYEISLIKIKGFKPYIILRFLFFSIILILFLIALFVLLKGLLSHWLTLEDLAKKFPLSTDLIVLITIAIMGFLSRTINKRITKFSFKTYLGISKYFELL